MMEDSNIDKSAKSILKQSNLEIKDPEFSRNLMKSIAIIGRRRQLRQNIMLGLLVFMAIDSLILLVLWLLGLSAFEVALNSQTLPQSLTLLAEKLKDLLLTNKTAGYVIVSVIALAIIDLVAESKFDPLHRKK